VFLVLVNGLELVAAPTIELQVVVVVRPQGFAVRDGEQRDAHLAAVAIHLALHVHGNGAGALIQNEDLRKTIMSLMESKKPKRKA